MILNATYYKHILDFGGKTGYTFPITERDRLISLLSRGANGGLISARTLNLATRLISRRQWWYSGLIFRRATSTTI